MRFWPCSCQTPQRHPVEAARQLWVMHRMSIVEVDPGSMDQRSRRSHSMDTAGLLTDTLCRSYPASRQGSQIRLHHWSPLRIGWRIGEELSPYAFRLLRFAVLREQETVKELRSRMVG